MAACHPPSIVWDHSVGFGPCDRVRIQKLTGELHISHTRAMCFLPFWWVSMASPYWNAVGGNCMLRHVASGRSGRSSAEILSASYLLLKPRVCSSCSLCSRPLKYQATLKIRSMMNVDKTGKRAECPLKLSTDRSSVASSVFLRSHLLSNQSKPFM